MVFDPSFLAMWGGKYGKMMIKHFKKTTVDSSCSLFSNKPIISIMVLAHFEDHVT